ncbi:N-acetylglucosamine-6-phosphate deacetylase [Paenibacillus sp. P96]|uniref:N-acetylglucosamine-6-phosphate deacetylase n=1 Tax=Paenibacillus zeirhizosphaerae TaxID=2987519 RepID=A0ABT9FM22_9BACL|nr:N-acetylglucosamine-6-phosphate deacetylase [Paenibacillus sp. P96]MDP4095724.1 N-acetylglucosamine-6-phosphate deacetylase [Paenibacillus sp. P96]
MHSNSNQREIIYGSVVTPKGIIEDGAVVIEEGFIHYAGKAVEIPTALKKDAATCETRNGYLLPGFIDIHIHGGNGADFMDASPEVLDRITSFHASQGTTAMLATTMTAPKDRIEQVLAEVNAYISSGSNYAQLAGVHLEGPFISPKWPGAQNPEHIADPRVDWVQDWNDRFPGLIKQLTLAPERDGALELVSWLKEHGITPAMGHTDASFEEVEAAVEAGLRHAVHTFNAMTPLHHRKPGAVGAVMFDPRIEAEVIADGIHVHPAAVAVLARLKQDHKLILITDAMSAAGLEDGHYTIGDLPVIVQGGVARLEDGVTLAGSTLTMIEGFRFLVHKVGLSITEASLAASLNPAMSIGIDKRTGSLEEGKQADILLLSPDLDLMSVWIKGKLLSSQEL